MKGVGLVVSAMAFLTALATTAQAQWSSGGDQRDLRGKTIVDVGVLTSDSKTVEGDRFTTSRRIYWREFQGRERLCFDDPLGFGSLERKAAVLLVDPSDSTARKYRMPYLATFSSSYSSVEVKVELVIPIRCPR